MDINTDQQYQQFKRDYQSLEGRSNLSENDQRRFNDLQGAISRWEASPNFHGERTITGNTRTGATGSSRGEGGSSVRQ